MIGYFPTYRYNLPWYGRSHVYEESRICIYCGTRDSPALQLSSCWDKCLDCWGKDTPNPIFVGLYDEMANRAVDLYCNVHGIDRDGTTELYEKLAQLPGARDLLQKYDTRLAVLKKP